MKHCIMDAELFQETALMDDQTNQTVGFTSREHVVQDLTSSLLEHFIHVYHYVLFFFASSYHPTQCPSSLVPFLSSNGFFHVTYIVFSPFSASLSSYSLLLLRKVLGSPVCVWEREREFKSRADVWKNTQYLSSQDWLLVYLDDLQAPLSNNFKTFGNCLGCEGVNTLDRKPNLYQGIADLTAGAGSLF